MPEIQNPLLEVLDKTFDGSTSQDLTANYIPRIQGITKWTCYSDYCFDDKQKPNDVVTFSLIPYVADFDKVSEHIKSIASRDIKNTRIVGEKFIEFLKMYPLINFSFILEDRQRLIGKDHRATKQFLHDTFQYIRKQYQEWLTNQPEQEEYYKRVDKKLQDCIRLITTGKKIKQITDMLLVTFLGGYISAKVIRDSHIEIFGWFSDRDSLNEVSDNFSIELFHYFFSGLTGAKPFQFAASPAGSLANPFYEELVRIPDYVAGTIADYNRQTNEVSKEKFNTMLSNYMAENNHNNFVYRLFTELDVLYATRITIHKKDE
jgi:hypothetical protein